MNPDRQDQDDGADLAETAERELAPLRAAVETAFADLSGAVAEDLSRMSSEGRQSIRELTEGVLEDIARIAADRVVRRPMEDAVGSIFGGGDGGRFLAAVMRRRGRNG